MRRPYVEKARLTSARSSIVSPRNAESFFLTDKAVRSRDRSPFPSALSVDSSKDREAQGGAQERSPVSYRYIDGRGAARLPRGSPLDDSARSAIQIPESASERDIAARNSENPRADSLSLSLYPWPSYIISKGSPGVYRVIYVGRVAPVLRRAV